LESGDLRTQGDKFFLAFLVAFVFVYFGIVLKPANHEEAGPRREAISSQRNLIEALRRQLHFKFERDGLVAGTTGIPKDTNVGIPRETSEIEEFSSRPRRQLGTTKSRELAKAEAKKQAESLKEEAELTERLAKASSDLANLISESTKETSHTIPFLSISIPESTILSLFPLGSFAGLLRLLYFRRTLLGNGVKQGERLPLWAGPLPTFMFERSKSQWLSVNIGMLTLVVLVTWFTGDYLLAFLVNNEDSLKRGFARLYAVIGAVSLAAYFVSLIQAVMETEPKSEIVADLEFE
jgi:hypothetical protein